MEELIKVLETMNEEQKQYMMFLTIYKKDNAEKRLAVHNFLKMKGFDSSKAFFLATIFGEVKEQRVNINKIEEICVADENYKTILIKAKQLANELNLRNSLQLSTLFTYLLWNGYFSKDKSLVFNGEDRNIIEGHYAFDIMNGKGVCLNFSEMLADFLNQFDYTSATIINKYDTKQKRNYMPEIERKISQESLGYKMLGKILTPVTNKTGNHAFNLISDNGQLYIYDATNLMIFRVDDKFKCSSLCSNGGCDIKPYFSHFVNNSDKSDSALFDLNMSTNFESPYTRRDFILTWENYLGYFLENESLLKSFHEDISGNIEIINDSTKDIKKLIKQYNKEHKK